MSSRHGAICRLVVCACFAIASSLAGASGFTIGGPEGDEAVTDVAVYRDPDRAALAVQPPPGSRNRYRHGLDRLIRENPLNAGALVQRGYWFAEHDC